MAPGGATILVVEDEPLLRLSIRYYLERNAYIVYEAASAEEALDLLRRHRISLMLMDLILPDCGGRGLSHLARAIRPSLPILCMSAYPKQWLGEAQRTPGDSPILEKPFTEAELVERIRKCLAPGVR